MSADALPPGPGSAPVAGDTVAASTTGTDAGSATAATSSGRRARLDDPIEAERDILRRLDQEGIGVDVDALAVVSNLYRAAAIARRHLEQQVLAPANLSWTAFVSLWVLWIWGEMESRHLAAEANVTKGTLTGVLDTLEGRGLVARRRRTSDRRLVMVSLTDEGHATIRAVYPRFNREEARIAQVLSSSQRREVAGGMRRIVRGLGDDPAV